MQLGAHFGAGVRPAKKLAHLRAHGQGVGAALASYLLFEAGYTQELMALGRADTLAMRAQVCQFFGWTDTGAEVRTQLHQ